MFPISVALKCISTTFPETSWVVQWIHEKQIKQKPQHIQSKMCLVQHGPIASSY